MKIGDMQIVPRPDGTLPPLKLIKMLGIIALEMHQEWAKPIHMMAHKDKSKESCILASLTVRDFLRAVGFERSRIAPVQLMIDAERDGKQLHSLGIGMRGQGAEGPGWDGHMVVVCNGWIVDTTIYQAIRPAWDDLAGMLVVPINKDGTKLYGLEVLTGMHITDDGYLMAMAWLDDPTNHEWKDAPDALRERRTPMVRHLVKIVEEHSCPVTS